MEPRSRPPTNRSERTRSFWGVQGGGDRRPGGGAEGAGSRAVAEAGRRSRATTREGNQAPKAPDLERLIEGTAEESGQEGGWITVMQRNEKQEMVGALHAMMAKANFAAAVAYKNIDAEATVKLRRTFRDAKVDYKVVKNTLARLAAKGTPLEQFAEQLTGPSAIILGYEDVVIPAKVLRDVLKEQGKKRTVKAAWVQGTLVDATGR